MILNKTTFNWYGFDHAKLRDHYHDLDGKLDYLGTFCVGGDYNPYAVYHAPNPDISKGHKEFVLIFKSDHAFYITGKTREQMIPESTQEGLYCPDCKEVIYSVMRHDYRHCACKKTSIDGGKDYVKRGLSGIPVIIDFLNNTVKVKE